MLLRLRFLFILFVLMMLNNKLGKHFLCGLFLWKGYSCHSFKTKIALFTSQEKKLQFNEDESRKNNLKA